MIGEGLVAFLWAAVVMGLILYAFAIDDDWKPEPGLYRFLGFTYPIAGVVAANACGRFTRRTCGNAFSSTVFVAIMATFVMELAIWASFIPVETFIRVEFFSLPPNQGSFF